MDFGSSFILAKTDRSHAYVHGQQIGSLRKVGHNAPAHGVLVLDVFVAAAK
jgi:hypothetical protein